ncbi:ester cyclase [Mycobacterium sp.]|uniref:ester cyclase n=1 Tax=Mycobacterium sp. TaxID=1785 RepID=UPI003A83722D
MNNKNLVRQYFTALWSDDYNPDKIRQLASQDMLWRYPMHGEFHGTEAVITMLHSFRESFPDLNFWPTADFLEDGDYVIVRWEGGGTHTGKALTELPYGGPIPAGSGRKVFFGGTSIVKIGNGKIVEEIGQEGAIDALLQLGAVNETVPVP